jgi:hypothetical protein
MPWELTDQEFENVRKLGADERYRYFISRVIDTERVWMLRSNDGEWAVGTDDDGTEVLPAWPHERYAAAAAEGEWAADKPTWVPLPEWLEALEHEVAVFPDDQGGGVRATQQRLLTDVKAALERGLTESGVDSPGPA